MYSEFDFMFLITSTNFIRVSLYRIPGMCFCITQEIQAAKLVYMLFGTRITKPIFIPKVIEINDLLSQF